MQPQAVAEPQTNLNQPDQQPQQQQQQQQQLASNRQLIGELRRKARQQCVHIMQLQRSLGQQQQQHRLDMRHKSEQLATLANQLMLLESRLKRRQMQIALVLRQREQTIVRQQRVIETLSNRLTDHGLGISVLPDHRSSDNPFNMATDLDSLNDSDSAVVLDDIDLDWASTTSGGAASAGGGIRRDSNGAIIGHSTGTGGSGGGGGGGSGSNTSVGGDGVTIVRSISDAIDTNYKASYGKRSSCFLRRPEVLETVYSVEEDHEAAAGSTAGATADASASASSASTSGIESNAMRLSGSSCGSNVGGAAAAAYDADIISLPYRRRPSDASIASGSTVLSASSTTSSMATYSGETAVVRQSQHYNRVMSSNHRSVTKPKDVKYRRINKVKSKSLEELCGQLKQTADGLSAETMVQQQQQTAQSLTSTNTTTSTMVFFGADAKRNGSDLPAGRRSDGHQPATMQRIHSHENYRDAATDGALQSNAQHTKLMHPNQKTSSASSLALSAQKRGTGSNNHT